MSILTTIFHDVWFECVIGQWFLICVIDIVSLLSLCVFVSLFICLFVFISVPDFFEECT